MPRLTTPTRSHVDALVLAARVPCDVRTARRLLAHGPSVVRSTRIRESPVIAAAELGLELGAPPPSAAPAAQSSPPPAA